MYYFIVNEHGQSGNSKNIWLQVQNYLKFHEIPYKYYISQSAGHATTVAQHVCALEDKDKRIIVVGGDGTVNEVLNGLQNYEEISFGVIPTGSGNDFCRGLGIPKNTEQALDKIFNSKADKIIDIGSIKVGDEKPRLFGISCGIGLDAIVTKKVNGSNLKKILNKLHMGNLTYILVTINSLFSMKTNTVKISFDGKPFEEYRKNIFVAFMNLVSEGGGIKMNPNATPFDGKLSLCMAYNVPKWKTFLKLPFLAAGAHGKLKGFKLEEASVIDVICAEPLTVHADGEYLGDVTKVHVECLKKRLKVLI